MNDPAVFLVLFSIETCNIVCGKPLNKLVLPHIMYSGNSESDVITLLKEITDFSPTQFYKFQKLNFFEVPYLTLVYSGYTNSNISLYGDYRWVNINSLGGVLSNGEFEIIKRVIGAL